MNRGLIAEKQGQWEDAARSFERAMVICRKFRLRADEAEVYFYLARLRFKTRDLDAARHDVRAAESLGLPELRPNLAIQFLELRRQIEVAERTAPSSEALGPP